MKDSKPLVQPMQSTTDAVTSAARYRRFETNDRDRAEALINAFIEQSTDESMVPAATDAALEFAAEQWDRLGKYMRMNAATVAASNPSFAVNLQLIATGTTDRANALRKAKLSALPKAVNQSPTGSSQLP